MRMTAALVILDHHELLTLEDLEMFEENKLTLTLKEADVLVKLQT